MFLIRKQLTELVTPVDILAYYSRKSVKATLAQGDMRKELGLSHIVWLLTRLAMAHRESKVSSFIIIRQNSQFIIQSPRDEVN